MDDAAAEPSAPHEYTCPGCSGEIAIEPQSQPQLIICPLCGSEFIIPAVDGSTILPDEAGNPPPDDRHDELDRLRIRKLATIRRSILRARSHCWIGIVVCVVGAIQLAINAAGRFRQNATDLRAFGYVLFAVLAVLAALHLYRKTRQFTQELQASPMRPQEAPPINEEGLSQLGDGSERWKRLEDIH